MFTKFIAWLKSLFKRKHKVIKYQVADTPVKAEKPEMRMTKAYADQRQKAPHNRKRKPSKAMRHLYHLS